MDALSLLKQDHRAIRDLLTELDKTTERAAKTRTELLATVKKELTVHERLEEEILYPAFQEKAKLKDIVLEGYEEHHVVDTIMVEVADTDVGDETWGAKLSVMKENIEHHIEEEEGKMFKIARQVFDESELVEIGERLATRKKEVAGEPPAELQETREAA